MASFKTSIFVFNGEQTFLKQTFFFFFPESEGRFLFVQVTTFKFVYEMFSKVGISWAPIYFFFLTLTKKLSCRQRSFHASKDLY